MPPYRNAMIRRSLVYFYLQLKRATRYLPFIIAVTLALCIALSLALSTLVSTDNSDAKNKKIKVATVGDFVDSYLDFGMSALQSMDSSRFTLEVLSLTEDEANEALANGEIVGYAIIPNEFIIDAVSGDVGQIQFVTNNSGVDMFSLFKKEVLDLISCLLVESQNGVYAMEDICVDSGFSNRDRYDNSIQLSKNYVTLIFNRANALEVEIVGISDSLSFSGYMFAGITVLIMLLSAIPCCPVFIRRDTSHPKLMNANRFSPAHQILGEYSAFFAIMLINTAILTIAMAIGAGKLFPMILELADFTIAEILILPLLLIPAALAITAMQFLLFELTDSLISGVLLQFFCALVLAYASGCFYPISFFPKAIRFFSSLTPSGIARAYLSSILSGADGLMYIVALIAYATILLTITVLVRARRIKA